MTQSSNFNSSGSASKAINSKAKAKVKIIKKNI